jgi:ankyrin repeat protein
MKRLRNHLNKTLSAVVLAGFSALTLVAHAGVYDEFFAAVLRDNPGNLQSLLKRGMDANTPSPEGQTGLTLALASESMKAVEVLMSWPKTDVNTLNSNGESPLMLAAIKGNKDIAEQLIKKGADVNKTGWTPLHYAASSGQLAIISLLLDQHAYIDAGSPNGTTPLMMAARYGTGEAVDLLLAEGADARLKNQQGLTALQFAEAGERPDAIRTLTALAAKASTSPSAAR